jgi:hypothetical protein
MPQCKNINNRHPNTVILSEVEGSSRKNVDPSTSLRFAQDDSDRERFQDF